MAESRLNTRFLFRGTLTLVAATLALLLAHTWQKARHARGQMARAEGAELVGELDSAAAALERYLRFAPGDVEVRSRYALLLDKQARSPRAKWRAFQALRGAASGEPARLDLRERIAELALELKDPAEALRHLAAAIKLAPDRAELREQQARAYLALRKPIDAADALEQAQRLEPSRLEIAVRLANLLHGQLGQTPRAEAALGQAITANPTRAEARVQRAQFRAGLGRLAAAEEDLAEARRLAPADRETLALSAALAVRRGLIADACGHWRKSLQAAPHDHELRARLARGEQEAGRPKQAEATLRDGLGLAPGQYQLLTALAELYVEQDRLRDAEATAAQMPADRPGLSAYLAGLMAERRGRPLEAANDLIAASKSSDLSGERLSRLMLALGRCYAALGAADEQLRTVSYAVGESEGTAARVELGRVLLELGRFDEGLAVLQRLAAMDAPPPAVWPLLARALVTEQAARPAVRRDWAAVERVLERAAPADEIAVALVRADVLARGGDLAAARRVFEETRERHPDEVALWAARVEMEARHDEWAGGEALDEADERLGARPDWLVARAGLIARLGGARARRQLAAIEDLLPRLRGGDRDRVELAIGRALARLGEYPALERLCAARLRRVPGDLQARALLAEALLARGDEGGVAEVVKQMRALEGEDGTEWRRAQVELALARGELALARRLAGEARRRRPAWPVPVEQLARVEDAAGHGEQAAGHYRQALALGDYRPSSLRRLGELMAARGRYVELDAELARAARAGALDGPLLRLAADVALKVNKPERAAELARQAVPVGKGTATELVWLGRVMGRVGREGEAEEALREAVRLAPGSSAAWLALVEHHDRLGRPHRADEAVEQMSAALDGDRRPLALARALEKLGRDDEALKRYDEALRRQPFDADALAGRAELLIRMDRLAQAETALRALLDVRAGLPAEERAEVRRRLALVMAGVEDALALLADNGAPPSEADRRAAALVRGRRTADRAAALAELDKLPSGPWQTPLERLRWAQLLDADDQWPRARAELGALIAADRRAAVYREALIDGLMRRGKTTEAAAVRPSPR